MPQYPQTNVFRFATPIMWQLLVTILWLTPTMTFSATLYIDGTLTSNCTTGTYSIVNRTCDSGADGNAYPTIAAALSASAANDTMRFRPGSYATPPGGLFPKAGQTWESCRTSPCSATETATITAGSEPHVIALDDGHDGGANITFRNLTLTGGTLSTIRAAAVADLTLDGLDISGWNTSNTDHEHGIQLASHGPAMQRLRVKNCVVHDPGSANVNSGGIVVGGPSSAGVIQNNSVRRAAMGIWLDTDAGDPQQGFTPHTVKGNIVQDIGGVCYHIEARSAWIMEQNIADGCGLEGIRIRPGGVGMAGHRYFNNTIYGASTVALWLPNETGDQVFTDAQFKNNIFISTHAADPVVNVGTPNHTDATVIFEVNWLLNLDAGKGVCWGDHAGTQTSPDFSQSCESPGVPYANTAAGYAAWEAAAANVAGVYTGDPLFVDAAQGDFRLCQGEGNPAPTCTGTSPAIIAGVNVGAFPVFFRCPLGQGFWKNHPDAWPVTSLTLGNQTYSQVELLNSLKMPVRGDASVILAHQLIATKLNIAYGSDPTPVSATITDADSLLSQFPNKLPYKVRPSSSTGQQMVGDATVLDSYNTGHLTPDCSA